MQRLTSRIEKGGIPYLPLDAVRGEAGGYSGEAVERLARFEDFFDDLISARMEVPAELEALRSQGKDRTVRFKELMVKKMMNASIMDLLKQYGLE